MRFFKTFLDVEVSKLARGKKTYLPEKEVLKRAARVLRAARLADTAPTPRDVQELERMYGLEDPRG